jgi:hypothetical protein
VHDEGDDGEDDKQVNQKTADVQDKESAQPENDEHHCQYEKHAEPSFSFDMSRQARMSQVIRDKKRRIRCIYNELICRRRNKLRQPMSLAALERVARY